MTLTNVAVADAREVSQQQKAQRLGLRIQCDTTKNAASRILLLSIAGASCTDIRTRLGKKEAGIAESCYASSTNTKTNSELP